MFDRSTVLRIVVVVFCYWGVATVPAAHASLVGIDFATGSFYEISTVDASVSLLGNTGVPKMGSLERGPDGFFYGVTAGSLPGSVKLYSIDPVTITASLIRSWNLGVLFEGAMAFAPNGTAYVTNLNENKEPKLIRVDDISTGVPTLVGTITPGAHDINGLAWRSDGKLVGLDRETNALVLIDPSNASYLGILKKLDPTIGGIGGMAVLNGTGYFATGGLSSTPPGSNQLYSFNLDTGDYQLIGNLPDTPGGGIGGLAVPCPSTALLMVPMSAVWLFRRRSR